MTDNQNSNHGLAANAASRIKQDTVNDPKNVKQKASSTTVTGKVRGASPFSLLSYRRIGANDSDAIREFAASSEQVPIGRPLTVTVNAFFLSNVMYKIMTRDLTARSMAYRLLNAENGLALARTTLANSLYVDKIINILLPKSVYKWIEVSGSVKMLNADLIEAAVVKVLPKTIAQPIVMFYVELIFATLRPLDFIFDTESRFTMRYEEKMIPSWIDVQREMLADELAALIEMVIPNALMAYKKKDKIVTAQLISSIQRIFVDFGMTIKNLVVNVARYSVVMRAVKHSLLNDQTFTHDEVSNTHVRAIGTDATMQYIALSEEWDDKQLDITRFERAAASLSMRLDTITTFSKLPFDKFIEHYSYSLITPPADDKPNGLVLARNIRPSRKVQVTEFAARNEEDKQFYQSPETNIELTLQSIMPQKFLDFSESQNFVATVASFASHFECDDISHVVAMSVGDITEFEEHLLAMSIATAVYGVLGSNDNLTSLLYQVPAAAGVRINEFGIRIGSTYYTNDPLDAMVHSIARLREYNDLNDLVHDRSGISHFISTDPLIPDDMRNKLLQIDNPKMFFDSLKIPMSTSIKLGKTGDIIDLKMSMETLLNVHYEEKIDYKITINNPLRDVAHQAIDKLLSLYEATGVTFDKTTNKVLDHIVTDQDDVMSHVRSSIAMSIANQLKQCADNPQLINMASRMLTSFIRSRCTNSADRAALRSMLRASFVAGDVILNVEMFLWTRLNLLKPDAISKIIAILKYNKIRVFEASDKMVLDVLKGM